MKEIDYVRIQSLTIMRECRNSLSNVAFDALGDDINAEAFSRMLANLDGWCDNIRHTLSGKVKIKN